SAVRPAWPAPVRCAGRAAFWPRGPRQRAKEPEVRGPSRAPSLLRRAESHDIRTEGEDRYTPETRGGCRLRLRGSTLHRLRPTQRRLQRLGRSRCPWMRMKPVASDCRYSVSESSKVTVDSE